MCACIWVLFKCSTVRLTCSLIHTSNDFVYDVYLIHFIHIECCVLYQKTIVFYLWVLILVFVVLRFVYPTFFLFRRV